MERSFEIKSFTHHRFLKNKHSQTIFSSFFPPKNLLKTEYLYENIGKSHTLLDPTISDRGIFISKWNLYVNIDRDSLLSSLYT